MRLRGLMAAPFSAIAAALVHEMRAHVLALDRNPEIGAPQAEYGQGVRMLSHGRYLIFYSMRGSRPLIERMWPSAWATGGLFES